MIGVALLLVIVALVLQEADYPWWTHLPLILIALFLLGNAQEARR